MARPECALRGSGGSAAPVGAQSLHCPFPRPPRHARTHTPWRARPRHVRLVFNGNTLGSNLAVGSYRADGVGNKMTWDVPDTYLSGTKWVLSAFVGSKGEPFSVSQLPLKLLRPAAPTPKGAKAARVRLLRVLLHHRLIQVAVRPDAPAEAHAAPKT